jgi:hypothetical protein
MSDLQPESFDPRKRRLCPDGSCVGVVAADGHCKVCGAYDASAVGLGPEAFAGGCASDDDDHESAGSERVSLAALDAPGDFDPQRKLCPDGACVGVIGDDGRCKVCGQSAGA